MLCLSKKYGTISPTLQVAYSGYSVTFTCYSMTKPKWKKDGGNIRGGVSITNSSLTLHEVSESDNGWYVCHGSLGIFKQFSAKSQLFVGGNYDCLK